jgi:putative addiction module killer protein
MYPIGYTHCAPTILRHQRFDAWLRGIADNTHRARIVARVDRLAAGNPGDAKSIGGGVMELRCNFGPGFRVYYVRRGADVIVLLAGGSTATQRADVALAKQMAEDLDL